MRRQSGFIEKDFWVKLLGNVSFNPVSALTLATADRLIADGEVKAYMVAIMREVLAIGRAVGVDADIDPEARIDMARKLGAFKTSMLQDMEAGKCLEIDGLLTGTLEVARKAGVPRPSPKASPASRACARNPPGNTSECSPIFGTGCAWRR